MLLFSLALLAAAGWYLFPPQLRVINRAFEFSGDHVSVIAQAVNDSSKLVTVTLRFTIWGWANPKTLDRILPLAEDDVSYLLPPHSNTPVKYDFALPGRGVRSSDVQIIKSL